VNSKEEICQAFCLDFVPRICSHDFWIAFFVTKVYLILEVFFLFYYEILNFLLTFFLINRFLFSFSLFHHISLPKWERWIKNNDSDSWANSAETNKKTGFALFSKYILKGTKKDSLPELDAGPKDVLVLYLVQGRACRPTSLSKPHSSIFM
jgi:hypothetical protein